MPPSPSYDFSMEILKLRDVYGLTPRETIASIVQDLVAFHEAQDLRNYE